MRGLGSLLAVIMLASWGCEKPPPETPQIKLDRASLGFTQEYGSGTYVGTQTPDTLIVMNEGLQDLVISSATKSGSSANLFTINSVTSTPIKYNEQGFIRVYFTPTDAGVYTATMTIDSNAANSPSLDVPLSGKGVTPP